MILNSTAWRMAWREARASAPKFLFVVFGVAAGVGALTGVRGFSTAFNGALKREARTLMASDLMVRQFAAPTDAQISALEPWTRRGVRVTRITETISMMSADANSVPVLVSVKAVDPQVYPFYGKVKLDPERPLAEVLTSQTMAVSDDLLLRLNIAVGSTVHLGTADFKVCGVVRLEPDRMTGSLNVGPRILISREGLERTGLVVVHSRASHRLLFKLPAQGIELDAISKALKNIFPESMVADYREGHPFITRSLERSTTFLSLVSLIALIVGALGVATAIHSHLQQRLDTIAILKCLGARSSQVIRIYTLQTVLLGLAGGIAGTAVGAAVQKLFPLLLARYFQLEHIPWSPSFALEGIAAGVLVTLLFTIPPLLSIRQVKPALIFRREMAELKPKLLQRLRTQVPAILSGALILAGLAGIASWLAESPRMGAYFIGGLTVALLLLAFAAWLLLRGLRALLKSSPVRVPIAMRHGIANLYRPGNHAASVLVALGIGVMFTFTIFLVQKSLLIEVAGAAPPGSPNVFLINITAREHEAIAQFLNARKDLQGKPKLVPLVPVRLIMVNGQPIEKIEVKGRRQSRFTRQATWMESKSDDIQIQKGGWWTAGETAAVMSVAEPRATALKIEPGMTLRWQSVGRDFDVRVAAIHRIDAVRFGQNDDFIFNRAALTGFPTQWFGAVRMTPNQVAAFQREAYQRFPTVTVINAAEVFNIVQEVVDQVALLVRFISAFAILAGVIILASTIAGTRLRRTREAAVLKTLGARRGRLTAIFSVEFVILGAIAGLMGGALATGFSHLLLTQLLDAKFRVEVLPFLATIVMTASLALVTGWLASLRILRQRPLEVLRDE